MDKNKAIEFINLAALWFIAVVFQYMASYIFANLIRDHVITDGLIASRGQFLALLLTFLRYGLTIGLLIASIVAWFIIDQCRIELITALIFTGIIVVLFGGWPYFIGKGQADWVSLIFYVESIPMCAGLWKLYYMWLSDVKKAEALKSEIKHAVKAESLPQTRGQGQEVANKTEDPKKEEKPIVQAPQPPKEPPTKPAPKKSRWRLNP